MPSTLATGALPRATDSGSLTFGDVSVECHVLDDGTRLITQRGVLRGIGATEDQPFARFVERIPNAPADFKVQPIAFRTKGKGSGGTSFGVTAEMFVQIVTLYARAFVKGGMHGAQRAIGERCANIMFALAGVGITAMIDEATGYQARRKRDALDEKLRAYLLGEAIEWERAFPEELYREAARMYGIPWTSGSIGKWGANFVVCYVYRAIDPDVAKELKRINPNPRFGSNHHLYLTERARIVLHEHVRRLIRVLKRSRNRAEFQRYFGVEFNVSTDVLRLTVGGA
jgi:hypothetical protein